MAESASPLRIISQPRAAYRERYVSEIGGRRSRAQRFIRADINQEGLDYPTIEIPKEWNRPHLYVRVTLVTVPTEQAPFICIHPYTIDTVESNVRKDSDRNSLYCPVSNEEFINGRKSFRISLKKLIQYQLKNYGQLRLLSSEQRDIQRTDDPSDARKLIDVYQLGRSRLLFTIAEIPSDGHLPIIYNATSVYSQIMTASTIVSNDDDFIVRCAPQKGDWQGGDEILMFIPKLDRRKTHELYFHYSSMNYKEHIQIEYVDTKTVSFVTPPCPLPTTGDNRTMEVPIIVIQGGEEIARVNFLYQSFDVCLNCSSTAMLNNPDLLSNYEQSCSMDAYYDDCDTFIYNNDENVKSEKDLS